MYTQPTTCRHELIDLFLRDSLSDAEQAAFESHLATCSLCRDALSDSAAEPELWDEAAEALSDDALEPLECGVSAPLWKDRAEDFDAELSDVESSRSINGLSDQGHGKKRTKNIQSGADTPHSIVPAAQGVLNLLAPTDDPHKLGRLGTYEIAGVIGCGGMGVVLKGFDASLNRFVAIKVLAPHLASSGAARRRFAREAQAAAAVVHDNVVAIHGVAESNGMPYLVMPYIRGESLQKRLDKRGPFAVAEILRVGMQVASGLAAAHAQGLVHRDIKPANILLEDGVERLRITDFGLARAADDASLTHSGVIAGTPQYMSPEQARGEVIDGRSDLFSLGSVLYALCTGRPPFRAETAYGVLHRLWQSDPRPIRDVNPEIPDWLAGVVMSLLQKSPNDRFDSAEAVARLMEQCLAHAQQPDQVPLPEAVRTETTSQASGAASAPRSVAIKTTDTNTTATTGGLAPPRSPVATRTRSGMATLGGLALFALLVGVIQFVKRPQPNELPDAPSVTSESQSVSASIAPDIRWDDGVAHDLESLNDDLQRLDAETAAVDETSQISNLKLEISHDSLFSPTTLARGVVGRAELDGFRGAPSATLRRAGQIGC